MNPSELVVLFPGLAMQLAAQLLYEHLSLSSALLSSFPPWGPACLQRGCRTLAMAPEWFSFLCSLWFDLYLLRLKYTWQCEGVRPGSGGGSWVFQGAAFSSLSDFHGGCTRPTAETPGSPRSGAAATQSVEQQLIRPNMK